MLDWALIHVLPTPWKYTLQGQTLQLNVFNVKTVQFKYQLMDLLCF